MALPIVPGSEVNTPIAGAKLDVGPLREAALAPGRMAQAIGIDAGNTFQQLSQDIQNARNTRKVFDADLAMRKTKDQFLIDIQKDPNLAKDPGTWVPEFQNRAQQTRDQILNQKDLGPVLKRHLTQMSDVWTLDGVSNVQMNALRRENADTREAGIATATKAIQDNQPDQAVAAYKAMKEAGVMGPKETAVRIQQVPSLLADSQANTVIATNPIDAPRIIREQLSKNLAPEKFRTLLNVAQRAQAAQQSRNLQELAGQMDQSPDGLIDKKMLAAKVKSGSITQAGMDGLVTRMDRAIQKEATDKARTARDDYNVGVMLAHDHSWVDDVNPEITARNMKDEYAYLPPALRRELYDTIDSRMKSAKQQGQSEERPVERDTLERLRNDPLMNGTREIKDLEATIGDEHVMTDADVKRRYGMSREDAVRKFQMSQAQQYDKMVQWFKDPANKNATDEKAEAYRQNLVLAPHATAAAAQIGNTVAPNPEGLRVIQNNLAAGRPWYQGSTQPIKVRAPNGEVGTVPATNLQKALSSGYTIVQ